MNWKYVKFSQMRLSVDDFCSNLYKIYINMNILNTFFILGAGGHGKVVADTAYLLGWKNIRFLDDRWPNIKKNGDWKVVGKINDIFNFDIAEAKAFVAIGDNKTRMKIFKNLVEANVDLPSLIHPAAVVSPSVGIGMGTLVCAGAIINAGSFIGSASICNSGAIVEHDCSVGDGVHICPGVTIAGNVKIKNNSWVGMGSSILQGICVGTGAIVGAGAVVINNIENNCTVVGVPAKRVN